MQITLNGCDIYYTVKGNPAGETIFFIHGGPGMSDSRGDEAAFSALGDTYQLVFMDNRGSGRSDIVPPYTHEQWISDIDAMRDYLGLDKIIILGGSYGGFLTLEYTLLYPDRVKAVILRDTAANQNHHHLSIDKALNSNLPGIDGTMLHRLFTGEVRSNAEFKEMIRAILPLYTVKEDKEADGRQLENIYLHYETHNYAFSVNQKQYDVEARLPEINVPVLITVGVHDWVTPVECSDKLAAGIRNNTYIQFENSGHSPHIEENEAYMKEVREFLKGCPD